MRLQTVDFSDPAYGDVHEVFVSGPGAPKLERIEDLAGQEVYARPSSSYFEHLLELNRRFREQGLEPIKVMPANENLETEDLLQMVNAGLFGITVADRYIAQLWQPLYSDLKVHQGFYLHTGGKLGWALRKNSPQLLQALNALQQGAQDRQRVRQHHAAALLQEQQARAQCHLRRGDAQVQCAGGAVREARRHL